MKKAAEADDGTAEREIEYRKASEKKCPATSARRTPREPEGDLRRKS